MEGPGGTGLPGWCKVSKFRAKFWAILYIFWAILRQNFGQVYIFWASLRQNFGQVHVVWATKIFRALDRKDVSTRVKTFFFGDHLHLDRKTI